MTIKTQTIKKCSQPNCDKNAKSKGVSKLGFTLYRKYCNKHSKSNYEKSYRKYKAEKCCSCGFVPVHSCQLDVDHIDGNKQNNSIENLQTLCANCHRLKTHQNKDYYKKEATEVAS